MKDKFGQETIRVLVPEEAMVAAAYDGGIRPKFVAGLADKVGDFVGRGHACESRRMEGLCGNLRTSVFWRDYKVKSQASFR